MTAMYPTLAPPPPGPRSCATSARRLAGSHTSSARSGATGAPRSSLRLPDHAAAGVRALNRNNRIDTRGVSSDVFFVPGILAYGIVTTAFSNIAISLAYRATTA